MKCSQNWSFGLCPLFLFFFFWGGGLREGVLFQEGCSLMFLFFFPMNK